MKTTLPQDTETRKLDHYDEQIHWITKAVEAEERGDWCAVIRYMATFARAIDASAGDTWFYTSISLLIDDGVISVAWASGKYDKSLFAYMPDQCRCLTQMKADALQGFGDKSDLLINPLIPRRPSEIRLHMLPEFARLQRKARGL